MQFSSDYLDLAIGLAAVFFLASLVVSALADGIQWPLRVRSKFLWAYLHDLTSAQRTHVLPRGKRGIVSLWGKKHDERPRTGDAEREDEPPTEPAVTSEAGGLQRLARALDPIDAPQLTRPTKRSVGAPASGEPAPERPRRTTIQSIPPRSLAQGFLEVFAEAGRIPLDNAVRDFAEAYAAGDQAASEKAAAALGQRLAPTGGPAPSTTGTVTASSLTAAFETYASAIRDATDHDGLRAAGDSLATALRTLPGVEGHNDLAADATKLAQALRPELVDLPEHTPGPDTEDHAELRSAAARGLVTGIIRLIPARFSRERIDASLAELGDSPLGITARRLWDGSKREINEFRTSLERYFDSEMSRLSGYYKRSIRIVLIALAVVVALVANVDAFAVAEGLWRNPDGRAALIAQADELARGEPTDSGAGAGGDEGAAVSTAAPTLALLQQRCRELAPAEGGEDPDPAAVAAGLQKVRACVDDALTKLSGLGVIDQALWTSPSGWLDDFAPFYRSDGEHGGDWALHTLGVALTATALVLGSSFWFDLIKRLTGLRRGLVGQT